MYLGLRFHFEPGQPGACCKPQYLLGFYEMLWNFSWATVDKVAERVGFEPTLPCGKHAFQACAFSHSAISPALRGATFRLYHILCILLARTTLPAMYRIRSNGRSFAGETNENEVDAVPDGRSCMSRTGGSCRSGFSPGGGQGRTPVSSPSSLLSSPLSSLPLDGGRVKSSQKSPGAWLRWGFLRCDEAYF
jgi:hypothetical protein